MWSLISSFWSEIVKFSKQNKWIYYVYALAFAVLFITGKGNVVELSIIFIAHMCGDVCMTAMGNQVIDNNKTMKATMMVGSLIIFVSIALYTFAKYGDVQYALAYIGFTVVTVKMIAEICELNLYFINSYSVLTVQAITYGIAIMVYGVKVSNGSILQLLGLVFLSASLLTSSGDLYWFRNCAYSIGLLTFGSGIEMIRTFINGEMTGASFSYFIFPLVVFLVFNKEYKNLKEAEQYMIMASLKVH
jgi:hypothetical protein